MQPFFEWFYLLPAVLYSREVSQAFIPSARKELFFSVKVYAQQELTTLLVSDHNCYAAALVHSDTIINDLEALQVP